MVFCELGHGLLTAANLGIGACGRAARVLGLNRKEFQKRSDGFEERVNMEEQKRIWWGVICLDLVVVVGQFRVI